MTFYVKCEIFVRFLEVKSQIIVDLFLTTGRTTAMFDRDRVDYKGNALPPPSTRNGRKTAGVHRKPPRR
jgi:hypothetical protein